MFTGKKQPIGGQLKSSHLNKVNDPERTEQSFYKASGSTALGGSSQLHSMDVWPDADRWHGGITLSTIRL